MKFPLLAVAALTVFSLVGLNATFANDNDSSNDSANGSDSTEVKRTWNQYASAISTSKETGVPVMLVFSGSDWCGWCIRLNNEVFATPEFDRWAQSNVLAVEVDFPSGHTLPAEIGAQNQMLKNRFGAHVQVYPTILFVDGNEQVIGKTGFVEGGANSWITQAQQQTQRQIQTRISQK